MINNLKRKAYNLLSYASPLDLSGTSKETNKIKVIKSEGLEIKMVVNSPAELWRAKTFFTKEPETIAWIKTLMDADDVFYDVGACVGVYSLFAGAFFRKKIKVIAIEPAYHNFNTLCKNIYINNLQDCITPYCIGLSSKTRFDTIYLSSSESGSSSHTVSNPIDQYGNKFKPQFIQGIFAITLEDLIKIYKQPFPNHIKIDVDGFEKNIIQGGKNILKDKRVQSVLIEVSPQLSKKKIERQMYDLGFNLNNSINYQRNHSKVTRELLGVGDIQNLIFTKTA